MSDANVRKRRRSAAKRTIVIGALLLAAGLAAYRLSRPPTVPAVRVAPSAVVQTVVATGRIAPPATVELGARQPGIVSEVRVKEGDTVAAGTLLVHLEDRELLAQKAAAQESVAQAKLRLDNLRRVLSPKAAEDLKQADLAVRQAEDDVRRIEVLANAGAANAQDLARASLALDQARSRREGLALQAGSVSAGGIEYRLGLSSLGQAEAALLQVDERIIDTHLTARIAGTVIAVRADVGDTVQPGQVLVVLAAAGALEVKVPIDEKNLAGVEPGRGAVVSAEAYPDRHFTAVVDRLSPAVDAARGTVEVTLRLPSPPPFLRPEMTASVEIEIARREGVLTVPREAVLAEDGKARVLVLDGDRARPREVVTGIGGADAVEIVRGLAAGDLVLLPGASGLQDGARVEADVAAAPPRGGP